MSDFAEISRIQAYLRENAYHIYRAVPLPPFTLFFHPTNALTYFNYAIPNDPDLPAPAVLAKILAQLRETYRQVGRVARFEFFEAFAPDLPAALQANGFREEDRQWSMLCTPASFRPAPDVNGLEITALGPDSPQADLRDFILTQRQGFNPGDGSEPSKSDLVQTRADLRRGWRAYLGRLRGEPACVSLFGQPIDGVSEVAGIATRQPFRRRGIASRLTSEAVQGAFALGVNTVCLTAANQDAGRVYERVGFSPFSTMLAYIDAEE